MVQTELHTIKSTEYRNDAQEKSYLNFEIQNVLCTVFMYLILLCLKMGV
jgi:hypothetical protein